LPVRVVEQVRHRAVVGEIGRGEMGEAAGARRHGEHAQQRRRHAHPPPTRIDNDRHLGHAGFTGGFIPRDGHATSVPIAGHQGEPAHIVELGEVPQQLRGDPRRGTAEPPIEGFAVLVA